MVSRSRLRLGRYQNFDFDPIPCTFKPSIESIEYRLSTQLTPSQLLYSPTRRSCTKASVRPPTYLSLGAKQQTALSRSLPYSGPIVPSPPAKPPIPQNETTRITSASRPRVAGCVPGLQTVRGRPRSARGGKPRAGCSGDSRAYHPAWFRPGYRGRRTTVVFRAKG